MAAVPAPADADQAIAMARAGLLFLAAADPAAMAAEAQARYLRLLEQSGAIAAAARASILGAFTAARGHEADGAYSPRAWLMHHTGITGAAAAAHVAWARRLPAHPHVAAALAAPAGPEDTRTRAQRCHDGLAEAMRRLAASDLLPDRAGQAVKAWVHVSLADLMVLDGDSALQEEWTARVRAAWAARRAANSQDGGDGGAWLDGEAAAAVACDAAMAPVVTGDVNIGALDALVGLCVQLDKLHRDGAEGAPEPDAARAREALEHAVIGKAADLVSGPGGLASFLRRRQLGARLAGPSLPLDIGFSDTVPAGIRNAVILRDQHCRFPGCTQPAKACHVHHVKHKADGGATSVAGCVLLCPFHHLVVIHRWGWTLVLNPDGTTTAWNPGRTKVLHSHGPPPRAG